MPSSYIVRIGDLMEGRGPIAGDTFGVGKDNRLEGKMQGETGPVGVVGGYTGAIVEMRLLCRQAGGQDRDKDKQKASPFRFDESLVFDRLSLQWWHASC